MKVIIEKEAFKYLQSLSEKERVRILEKIKDFKSALDKQLYIPFKLYDIKALHGVWEGFYRLRVGNFRIIFTFIKEEIELHIYHIHSRGDIYKKK